MDPDPDPANFVCDLQDFNEVFGLLIFEGTLTSLLSKKGNLFFALDLYGLCICFRVKLDCWWHLMQLLGENLPHHAVEVVQVPPLLSYCVFVTDNTALQLEFPTSHPSGPLFFCKLSHHLGSRVPVDPTVVFVVDYSYMVLHLVVDA
jgi:hypothetical protein